MSEKIKTDVFVEFQEEIGQNEGRNSLTFLGYDRQLNIELVIKEFGALQLNNEEPNDSNSERYSHYFKEAQMLNKAQHPNVLQIYYAGFGERQDDRVVRIATKHLIKGSLDKFLRDNLSTDVFIPIQCIIDMSNQILQGLIHIHRQGILHLDLKPTNILLEDNRDLVIADFGQSIFYEPTNALIPGQYHFHLAPEILRGIMPNHQTDIYQFGVTMYRICGYELFHEQLQTYFENGVFNTSKFDSDIINGLFPDRNKYHNYIPKSLVEIINKCMITELSRRYQRASDIMHDINRIADYQIEKCRSTEQIKVKNSNGVFELDFIENEVIVYKKTEVRRSEIYRKTGVTTDNVRSIITKLRTGSILR